MVANVGTSTPRFTTEKPPALKLYCGPEGCPAPEIRREIAKTLAKAPEPKIFQLAKALKNLDPRITAGLNALVADLPKKTRDKIIETVTNPTLDGLKFVSKVLSKRFTPELLDRISSSLPAELRNLDEGSISPKVLLKVMKSLRDEAADSSKIELAKAA